MKLFTRVRKWLRNRKSTTLPIEFSGQMMEGPARYTDEELELRKRLLEINVLILAKDLEKAEFQMTEAKNDCFLSNMRLRPSHRHPVIVTNDGLEWTCRMTRIFQDETAETVVGTGNCPEQAMYDYDCKWFGVDHL